jgi:hypothetical protein
MARLPRLGISIVGAVGLLAGGLASFGSVSAQAPVRHSTTAEGSYVSVTPYRVADTRTSSPLAGGAILNVQVAGAASGVPVGAAAAVLNVTAVNPTAAGFLTVWPEGTTPMPTVSNLNFAAGTTPAVANLVTVGLSASGGVSIYLNTGSTNVVVDVEGYYATSATTSGLYNPLSPSRAFGSLTIGTAIGPGVTTAVTVAGASAIDGVPATASAVVLNVTAAWATAPSFLTVFPAGTTPMPTASNLNFGAQAPLQAIANRVTVGVGTSGQIDVYNHWGNVNVDVDVDGYYSGTGGVGSPFVAITPIRVADTRTATKVGTETAIPAPPPQAAATEPFTLATPDIPATAAGVAMNLTAVPGNKPGYLTSYPTVDTTPPVASDVNWTASESPAVPNFTIADTAGTGIAQNVDVANSYFTTGATVDVIADAFGYFAPSTAPVDTLAVTASPATILDNGTATSTITATVTNSSGPVVADPVTLALTGTCGSSSPASVSTNATGVASFTYTASTTAGICTVKATEGEQGVSGTATVDQTATAAGLTMLSAAVTDTTIAITYNEPVTCPTTLTSLTLSFTYDWTGTASGITALTGCTAVGDVLTLAGTFTLPSGTATIKYTAPPDQTTPVPDGAGVSVWATGTSPAVYAATQTITVAAVTTLPAMVSAYATGTTLVITYNEDVTCAAISGANLALDFAYDYTGSASGLTSAGTLSCASTPGTDFLTLTATGTVTPPTGSASIKYTAPPDQTTPVPNSAGVSVYATGSDPALYEATQTITTFTAPSISGATVTPGASGTGTIAVTYLDANTDPVAMTCPLSDVSLQAEFAYSNGGAAAYPSTCGAAANVLTLGTFYTTPTGTTGATLVLPGASDTLTYTAPTATNTVTNSVNDGATEFPQFAATQTFALGAAPAMVSAVVTGTTIAITYNEKVVCPTGIWTEFAYDYETGFSGGGSITSCSGDGTTTLTFVGTFTEAPTSTASIVYTQAAPDLTDAVSSSATGQFAVSPQTISGAALS